MTTIKIRFRPSEVSGREGTMFYQITCRRQVRQVSTGFRIYADEWDGLRSRPRDAGRPGRGDYLREAAEGLHREGVRIRREVARLGAAGEEFSADDVVEALTRYRRDCSFRGEMERCIRRLSEAGRVRTAETYQAALRSFGAFRKGKDVMMDGIDTEMMEGYEAWLRGRGVTANTVSFYMRILRAVYHRAVDRGLIDDVRPFRHVYTGVDRTVRRALRPETLRRMRTLELGALPRLDRARDMFMMSFYLRGMSLIDMACLRTADLCGGRIVYRRRKTGRLMSIGWTAEMQAIADKWGTGSDGRLLPLIPGGTSDFGHDLRRAGAAINRALKRVGEMAGAGPGLTLYAARHSWASTARAVGIPLSVISEGMGHESELTTRIYLASLDTAVVDEANSRIIGAI